jgi:hypothetical protein
MPDELAELLAVLACAPGDGLSWLDRLVGRGDTTADTRPAGHPDVLAWLARLAHA